MIHSKKFEEIYVLQSPQRTAKKHKWQQINPKPSVRLYFYFHENFVYEEQCNNKRNRVSYGVYRIVARMLKRRADKVVFKESHMTSSWVHKQSHAYVR